MKGLEKYISEILLDSIGDFEKLIEQTDQNNADIDGFSGILKNIPKYLVKKVDLEPLVDLATCREILEDSTYQTFDVGHYSKLVDLMDSMMDSISWETNSVWKEEKSSRDVIYAYVNKYGLQPDMSSENIVSVVDRQKGFVSGETDLEKLDFAKSLKKFYFTENIDLLDKWITKWEKSHKRLDRLYSGMKKKLHIAKETLDVIIKLRGEEIQMDPSDVDMHLVNILRGTENKQERIKKIIGWYPTADTEGKSSVIDRKQNMVSEEYQKKYDDLHSHGMSRSTINEILETGNYEHVCHMINVVEKSFASRGLDVVEGLYTNIDSPIISVEKKNREEYLTMLENYLDFCVVLGKDVEDDVIGNIGLMVSDMEDTKKTLRDHYSIHDLRDKKQFKGLMTKNPFDFGQRDDILKDEGVYLRTGELDNGQVTYSILMENNLLVLKVEEYQNF